MATRRWATLVLAAVLAVAGRPDGAEARDVDYCYAHMYPDDRYLFFSSKTAYELVRDKTRGSGGQEILPHCEFKQLWLLNRHGTRYPGKPTIAKMGDVLWDLRDRIIQNHLDRDGRLCDEDLDALREWRLNVTESQANMLTWQGEQDMLLLAERLRDRFPSLLRLQYNTNLYQFRHTNEQRTKRSAQKFAEGLFGAQWGAVFIPQAVENDTLLQPYATCDTWKEGDVDEPAEYRRFISSADMDALMRNVSTRLGFRAPLKFDVIYSIFDMCRYDKAWLVVRTSPWCAAFSRQELQLLEYAEDLKYYYRSGYGNEYSKRLACPLVKDLVTHFDALSEQGGGQRDQPKGIFYFAHSSGMHMLQTALGGFKDATPLRADNWEQQRRRQWRVSFMGPFAGNVAALFAKCDEGERERVLFLSAEGPMDIEGADCRVGLCPWRRVRQLLQPVADTCNLQWCNADGAAPPGPARVAPPAAVAVALALIVAPRLSAP